jgi:hypothetical protein
MSLKAHWERTADGEMRLGEMLLEEMRPSGHCTSNAG